MKCTTGQGHGQRKRRGESTVRAVVEANTQLASAATVVYKTLQLLNDLPPSNRRVVYARTIMKVTQRCFQLNECKRKAKKLSGNYTQTIRYQTTVAFCRTLVVAHCGPTPMTRGSYSCPEHITNSVIGVSRPPVLDCGTTFHLDYGGRDLPSTPSDNLSKLIYLATEALSDSSEFIGAI